MKITCDVFLFFIVGCISLLSFSCKENNKKESHISKNHDVENFLSLFEEMPSDTFEIESTDMIVDSIPFAFKGKLIDTLLYKFIDDDVTLWAKPNDYDLFACYKKKISKNKSLLILRVPSEYWESNLRLYVFDHISQKTIAKVDVAENWGDGGDTYYLSSYLLPQNGNHKLISFTNYCWAKDENMEEFECADSTYFYSVFADKIIMDNKLATDSNGIYKVLTKH